MLIHPTTAADWPALKSTRLAALLDAPTAFGASHASAAGFSDADWQQRATSTPQRTFFLAFGGEHPIGLAAQVVAGNGECHLIAMWVHREYRGMAVAQGLVDAVKQCAVGSARRGAGKCTRRRVLPETGLCLFAGVGSAGKPSAYPGAEDGMAGAGIGINQ
ncbi:hypothetical protein JAB6_18030 [Janthinobacterium sp. HH104]|uniref:GNAT family N-acetyltransferase n=1 Tax=Janthinobacterium sp. HH104 TaxID=1537276 RepID=UPI0008934935|nr:GNAT family N-acetyltransferase [Janthinobacterium sp. HH104]OEZ86156.1 hypothetical protein JAB6_17100 [Janthinobacterium sp. HH104]OEZ86249.1 hypothetical protein JAB6_18030 [Janthinobacterium sp. HH104]